MVCIDDFAIRKGVKYATVMIDINSHKIIDMINPRDYEEVTSWLKEFPNLKIVSRHDVAAEFLRVARPADQKAGGVRRVGDLCHGGAFALPVDVGRARLEKLLLHVTERLQRADLQRRGKGTALLRDWNFLHFGDHSVSSSSP